MSGETLRGLAAAVSGRLVGDPDVAVRDVTHDSRQAGPGVLFVALRGATADGHDYLEDVVASGTPAVVVESEHDVGVPQLVVDSTRARLGRLSARVHGLPSRLLSVVGITGTNGKTTVVHMLESVFQSAGLTPGRIGTTGARSGARTLPTGHTTPEASEVQRLLATMVADGVEAVAMEVSSHALSYGRVEEVEFDVAAFTNLSQDHLDFHRSMEAYFAAKRELFFRAPRAVVPARDPWGERLVGELPPGVDVIRVGSGAAISAAEVDSSMAGSTFTLAVGSDETAVRLPLVGAFNVANALVAAGVATALGVSPDAVRVGLEQCPQVPGRFEVVRSPRGTVVVDYAHTPEAIEAAIEAARKVGTGRVLAVFGAGGDRDRDKRPLMGAAGCLADLAIVTNDNPRSEDPDDIAAQIVAGMPEGCEAIVELDRRRALELAVARAGPGDTVLLLGKGHEPGQVFADHVEPFDDRSEAVRVLEASA